MARGIEPARKATAVERAAPLAALCALWAFTAAAQQAGAVRDQREDWGLDRVQSELLGLSVYPEVSCAASTIADGWSGKEPDIKELHGGLFSPYDGVCFPNFHYVEIEHIVSRKEADDSGMCNRSFEQRKGFASDLLNLTFAPSSLNASKGMLDAGDLESAGQSLFLDSLTGDGKCFLAAQTIRVKSKYGLSVDWSEREALARILEGCKAEQRSVERPQAPVECDWVIRREFAAAVAQTEYAPTAHCSAEAETREWHAALQYADEIACLAGTGEDREAGAEQGGSPAAGADDATIPDPRASQIALQEACEAVLDTITCGNIKEECPAVTVIHRGEPLYQAKGTNGKSNDSDDNGLYCESL